jgi:hypothetical protein
MVKSKGYILIYMDSQSQEKTTIKTSLESHSLESVGLTQRSASAFFDCPLELKYLPRLA